MRRRFALAGLLALAIAPFGPGTARAEGPPQVESAWVTEVTASGAALRAIVNPGGATARYRFEYLPEAAYEANLAAAPPREGFAGASRAPASGEGVVGSGETGVQVSQQIAGLLPLTVYRYRVRATSALGTGFGPEHTLRTQGTQLTFALPDDRGWEMVSPVDKNGGAIESVGTGAARVFQAAADGQSVTYSSRSAFGAAGGAPTVSQYLARRGGAGWASENLTLPLLSGSYGDEPDVTQYQLFSPDLARSLVLNGRRCRGSEGECPVANPPLPGTGAPAGYVDYYRREAGGFASLLSAADVSHTAVPAERFELRLAAAAPDLGAVVLSSCAALTANAEELEAGPGACDESAQNLYEWNGSGLEAVNVLPGQTTSSPGAAMAAEGGAVSGDGSRAYWVDSATGGIYLHRRGSGSVAVGEGTFQVASADGSVAYFTGAGHLYRYVAASETASDLTPAGEVEGVLGASADGSYVYFATVGGVKLWHGGITTPVAAAADSSDFPPSTGTAQVTPDGRHLLFLASASLTGYDNAGKSEVFLYGPPAAGGAATLACVSCNPTGERPRGPSSIPGAVANGPGAVAVYKPRAVTVDGSRVFFDSEDALAVQDTDGRPDVYEWEASGVGGCPEAQGCISLIGSGRSAEGSSFVDASADGSDVFFLTDASLVPGDPGLVDLYDAREGGGLPVAPKPIPCDGDACQGLPSAPEDPTPGTLTQSSGNPVPPAAAPAKAKKKAKKAKKHRRRHRKGGRR